jgi:alcohol dehydrogenase (cytochrome c)
MAGLALLLFVVIAWPGALDVPRASSAQARASFTSAQAEQGAVVYQRHCSSCHGQDLGGTAEAPALAGPAFVSKWRSQMAMELYRVAVQTMPPNRPGLLSEADALAVEAFILQRNGAAAGAQPLTAGQQAPISSVFSAGPAPGIAPGVGGAAPGRGRNAAPDPRLAELRMPLNRLTPVTDAMLRGPASEDWLMWRRTYNGWGHSPLTQINRDNVKNLTVSWTWALNSSGMTEFTPLVHDGIMFVWNYGELIQALDARNGNLLWQYRHPMPEDYSRNTFYRTKRALAIGGNKLIVPTTDMHLVALDVKTGAVIWDVVTDDARRNRRVYNGGPLVINGKVIMGASGCAPGIAGCFISAHDLETGRELWRFNTIAQPGEPGDDTWNNVPAEKRWGASVWTPPSYDPELNLLFVGTGSPYPWSSEDRGTYKPDGGGHRGDSLYTSCTLAIDPDTGKLVWYYAHLPNDTFDQDYAFERVIVPLDWGGRRIKAVLTAGKPAVIEVLDAATGTFLFARDPGAQNIFTIDQETGVKTLLPPGPPDGIRRCPSNDGARNYLAGSYDPATNRYYLSVNDICTGKGGETPDRLLALDLGTTEFALDIKSRVMQSSAKLTTAGGLLFSASADRYFRAYDTRNGTVLWQTRVQDVPSAFPITYAVDGKQYIAMIAGNPGLIGTGAVNASPEYLRPESASVLWVWSIN